MYRFSAVLGRTFVALSISAAIVISPAAFAASGGGSGGGSSGTVQCRKGLVYDKHKQICVPAHSMNDRQLYEALPQFGEWIGLQVGAPPAPEHELQPGERLRVGRCEFEVRHTPGHSPGSVSFVGNAVVFGGDVLFNGSIGRTDLPGGDHPTLLASIQTHFLSLPDSTVVYSGHGPETTIGVERLTNPWLTGSLRA